MPYERCRNMEPASRGALVISLDFELQWGVRDVCGPAYAENLRGERRAIPAMLDLFAEYGIAATWATVGFLFARDRDEMHECLPALRPTYKNPALDPYLEPVGRNEQDDPLHYAPSLIRLISGTPRQEIGTHTFSHYYCLEPGQTWEQFSADLDSAVSIAARHGIELRSIAFPRNQVNPLYLDLLSGKGITCYRGAELHWMYKPTGASGNHILRRLARAVDSYISLSGPNVWKWGETDGLFNAGSSRFLRPYSPRLRRFEPLRLHRILGALRAAASTGQIFHLWWHPHNFGVDTAENIAFLRSVLEEFSRCRDLFGMRSLSMAEACSAARRDSAVRTRLGSLT